MTLARGVVERDLPRLTGLFDDEVVVMLLDNLFGAFDLVSGVVDSDLPRLSGLFDDEVVVMLLDDLFGSFDLVSRYDEEARRVLAHGAVRLHR